MPNALKAIIAFNLIAVALIGYFAYVVGGGFEPAVFPPDHRFEIRLVPVAKRTVPEPYAPATTAARIDVPPAFRSVDPAPRPWEYLPDGSVRFDAAR